MTNKKIVAIVPVKGTSSRVVNKNVRPFNGEPFFLFTVRKLLKCKWIDEVYVDSENDQILALANSIGALPLKRDPELADNRTDGNKLFLNEVRNIDADIYIQHLCTSPFVSERTIRKAVDILNTRNEIDSVVLGKSDKNYHWRDGKPVYDINNIPNSVDLPETHTEGMSLYVIRRESALATERRIGTNPMMIFGEPIELIDVNTEEDLQLATVIGAGLLAKEEKRLSLLRRFLTSPIISDVCDELGITSVLSSGYRSNLPHAKLFGRARTLHIREANPTDPPGCIYEALQSYKQVVSNDVIIVKTELPEFAYFGELNMSLAIRSGAQGAIVAGATRDSVATSNAAFPVFSKSHFCKDIKGRGAVKSINAPVEIDGITVNPSDLVFADQDGIVVIPYEREAEILNAILKVMSNERNIVSAVCQDIDVNALVEKYGFF